VTALMKSVFVDAAVVDMVITFLGLKMAYRQSELAGERRGVGITSRQIFTKGQGGHGVL
jgi:hypothetical protein